MTYLGGQSIELVDSSWTNGDNPADCHTTHREGGVGMGGGLLLDQLRAPSFIISLYVTHQLEKLHAGSTHGSGSGIERGAPYVKPQR